MNDQETRVRNRQLVERLFDAVGRGDVAGQLEMLTDDVVLEFPYADPPARLEGKDAIRARLEPALEIFRFSLHITNVYDCADPEILIFEYTSEGEVTSTGKAYRNSYIGVVRFRAGEVCFHREYYNPLVASRALSD